VLAFLLMGFVILSRPERILVKGNAVKDYIAEKKIGVREPFWMAGIKTIKEYPLSGIGMNRIRLLPSVGYESSHVHNQLIHTAAELGIPALVAYLAILIGAGWMCYKVWLQSGVGWMRAAALGLGAGQMAHFVFGMGDSIPLGAKPGVFFWFSLALITAMFNYIKRKEFSVQDPE
jgi:O-antigen ligase